MAGQFATRRGPGGRLEKIPEEEAEALRAAAKPGAVTQADLDFIESARGAGGGPPPLPMPEAAGQPPMRPKVPPPVAPPVQAAPAAATAGAGVAATAKKIVPGAAALFLAQTAAESLGSASKSPIGTLEGPSGTSEDESVRTLREILNVQKGVARFGTPIKDQVTTKATDSRL